MVVITLLALGLFVVVGVTHLNMANYTPFAPNGFTGIHQGAAIVFFAYIGFDAISTAAEETVNPQRNLPIGILGGLAVCTVIYVVVGAVLTGMVPYKLLANSADPLSYALEAAGFQRVGWVVALGAAVSMSAVLLVFQYGQPRIFFSMARDGLLPASFAKVHPRFRTPHVTTILTGIAVGVCAMFTSIDEMVDLTNIGTLFAFILVCVGILILRKRDPGRRRAFRTPFVPVVPVLGILSCGYLMLGLPWITWLRFALWLLVGLVIYFAYGMKRSGLRAKTSG
jgi:APA family basic amino acid/polyamine antiporter